MLPGYARAEEVTAEQYADQAYQKYEKGAYAEAIALYMKSYEISRDARIVFNVAQIYDKKIQDRELAIEFYRRYLKTTTTEADLVKRATDRIAALSAAPAAATAPATTASGAPAATAPAPAPAPTQAAPEGSNLWIGWTATGALAVGALVTGILAASQASDARNTSFFGASSKAADDKASSAKTMALVSTVLTGGTLLAGGITLYLSTRPSSSTALVVRPGAFTFEGTF
ncbi:MAG: soluble NSF attachment family protein [Polyangiaceae bacterium]|jgi:tetratricopeptide (TPR) repeat protein|nr:soluble NSF attachment family protein [Polyangiaceae bacterium]